MKSPRPIQTMPQGLTRADAQRACHKAFRTWEDYRSSHSWPTRHEVARDDELWEAYQAAQARLFEFTCTSPKG